MKQNKKVELLAPAGSKEAFYGAIHAGADAVYLGGSRFGARAYADNFTEEELISCIRYAHLWGRKVYLTVNTLVKEAEFQEIYDYLSPYYEAGLDGVIVQDIGVFAFIRENFPDMELHVSTQMTITGKYGAGLLQKMGACRVVPARELSLAEIVKMKEATGLEIECFIHGAMCYCYSGQCLFSSILGGRSGNRGRCAQPCRLPYKVQNGKGMTPECYPLSLKDMCTVEHIPELIEAGIDSFKIEGRMKKPEYAAGVTAIYRKYIDNYYKAPHKPFKVSKEDLQKLSCLYIRSERQDGYYHKHNGREMVTLNQPSYSGSDEALLAEIRRTYLEERPKLMVAIYGSFMVGEAATVTFCFEDLSVTVTGDIVQQAQKQPISRENAEKQLKKLGDSIFKAESIEIVLDDQAFYPLKEINELRRKAVLELEDALIQRNQLPVCRKLEYHAACKEAEESSACEKTKQFMPSESNTDKLPTVSIRTINQLDAVIKYSAEHGISRLYANGDLFFKHDSIPEKLRELANSNHNDCPTEIIISLPYILRDDDETYLEKLLKIAVENSDMITGFQVKCLEGIGFLKNRKYNGKIYADAGLYVWNKQTVKEWDSQIDGFCIPYELKTAEQRPLMEQNIPCEKIFYGRIPMMITANCVARTTDVCRKTNKENQGSKKAPDMVKLIDRYQKQFPVVLNCEHCMNIIYNSVPLSLHKEWAQLHRLQPQMSMRLDFTVENAEDTYQILDYFNSILQDNVGGSKNPPYKDYTTGHEKRGVE